MKRRITHGIVAAYDYAVGTWLILLPWLLHFEHSPKATVASVVIGFGVITNSIFTNYRFGIIKFIPEGVHSLADVSTGVFLCVAPWLLDYHQAVFWPHIITGLFCLAVALNKGRQGNNESGVNKIANHELR